LVAAGQERPLAALLVVHHDLQRQPRPTRPFRIRKLLAVADEVTRIAALEGRFAPLPTGGPSLRLGLALPLPRSNCAGGTGARTRALSRWAAHSRPVPGASRVSPTSRRPAPAAV